MRKGIIICVAGNGSRVGGNTPKQFIQIGEKRMIDYTIDTIFESGLFNDIVIMVRNEDLTKGLYAKYVSKGAWVIRGDEKDGQNTRKMGLEFCKEVLGYQNRDLIGIADGNRPFIDVDFYKKLVKEAEEYGNAIPYVIQKDILLIKNGDNVDNSEQTRDKFFSTIAPSFFPFGVVKDAYDIASEKNTLSTSEGLVNLVVDKLKRMNITKWIHFVKGDAIYFKVTTPDDVEMAKLIAKGLGK